MGRFELKGVVDKDGRLYYRRRIRVDGKRKTLLLRLPAADHPDFARAYQDAVAVRATPERPALGTFAALVAEFRAAMPAMRSKRGKPLSPATIANYRLYADRIEAEHGKRLVRQMRPAHVYRIRDRMADRPGTANNYLAILRKMLAFACERDWIDRNPAAGVPALPLGEHEPWPARVLEAAMSAATPMTRLAIAVGLCTGQRIGDCIAIQHGHRRGGIIEVAAQGKTGVAAAIPEHPLLTAELARVERRAVTLLYDRFGRPFSDPEPIQSRLRTLMDEPAVRAAINEAVAAGECEVDVAFTFHGLRKNACCYLLELGLSDAAVGAMLGMSAGMVRHYGKKKRALMVALDAVGLVTGGTIIRSGAPPVPISGHRV